MYGVHDDRRHQNSQIVADPITGFDLSLVSDGARLYSHHGRSCKDPETARLRAGQGFGEVSADLWWEKKNFTHMAVPRAKEAGFRQAGLTLATWTLANSRLFYGLKCCSSFEDYGFCKKGEGGPFVESVPSGPGAVFRSNTGGAGLLSCYHLGDLTGMADRSASCARSRRTPDRRLQRRSDYGHGRTDLSGMCSIHTGTLLGGINDHESNVIVSMSRGASPCPTSTRTTRVSSKASRAKHSSCSGVARSAAPIIGPRPSARITRTNFCRQSGLGGIERTREKIFAFNRHQMVFHPGFKDEVPYCYA